MKMMRVDNRKNREEPFTAGPSPSHAVFRTAFITLAMRVDNAQMRDASSPFAEAGGEIKAPASRPAASLTRYRRGGPGRSFGSETGCHTCGVFVPGTGSGNFVPDHQLPNARNPLGWSQRLFPHFVTCSSFQGRWIGRQKDLGE